MTSFWFIRHAPIESTGLYTGQSDVDAILPPLPLSMSVELPAWEALWFASPLKRAAETAKLLMTHYDIDAADLQFAPELKEQHFGKWEGENYYDVWKEAEHAYDWNAPEKVRPDGGESFADVCARVDRWIESSRAEYPDKTLIVVAHAGPLRAALRHVYNADIAKALSFEIACGSLVRINYSTSGKAELQSPVQPCWFVSQT